MVLQGSTRFWFLLQRNRHESEFQTVVLSAQTPLVALAEGSVPYSAAVADHFPGLMALFFLAGTTAHMPRAPLLIFNCGGIGDQNNE